MVRNPSAAAKLTLATVSGVLALCFVTSSPPLAGQVTAWWGGFWACTVDGRPARMKWGAADYTPATAGIVSISHALRWKGSFSDNGSRWMPLTNPRQDAKGGLYFRHADGNQWYLAKPVNNKTKGWMTWNGQRYPLSCWR
jgi:Family of unknown function (DUF6006)